MGKSCHKTATAAIASPPTATDMRNCWSGTPRPVMRGATGLDGDARGREAFEERDHVPATQLPAQDGPFGGIDAVELEDVLGRVHANAANLFHGWPPHVRSATTSPWHSDAVQGAVHPNTCPRPGATGAGSGWRCPART